ncbi:MAG TPA: hypothetical protein VGG74_11870 [Kofleriaceae bacterium]|jgi:hypothetical protein
MTPNPKQLRLFANQWRNMATAAKTEAQVLREHDVSGYIVAQAIVAEAHALTTAAQLEDLADHIEALVLEKAVPECTH